MSPELLAWIKSNLSTVTMLVVILYGGYKRYWVWGYQLVDAKAECIEWKNIALRGLNATTRAVEMAQQVTTRTE